MDFPWFSSYFHPVSDGFKPLFEARHPILGPAELHGMRRGPHEVRVVAPELRQGPHHDGQVPKESACRSYN